jgi:hypothetical protein
MKGGPRCGKWMPKAKTYCGLQLGHSRKCMTPEAVKRHFDQQCVYHLARRAERRAFIDSIKLAAGCIDCGYNLNAEVLDFDHLDSATKIAGIAAMIDHSMPLLIAEIAKCVVRCANCHRIVTQARRKPASIDGDGLSTQITGPPPRL